jgi:hypothetical protein
MTTTIAPGGDWISALSNDKSGPGYGEGANTLRAKINAEPAVSFP